MYSCSILWQTVPDTGIMPCPGDKVVLTCTTDTGSVVWEADNGAVTELTHLIYSTYCQRQSHSQCYCC